MSQGPRSSDNAVMNAGESVKAHARGRRHQPGMSKKKKKAFRRALEGYL